MSVRWEKTVKQNTDTVDNSVIKQSRNEQNVVYPKAYQQLEILSLDEATRAQYEAREAWLRDEATRQYEAENRGWRKGLQEGEAKGRLEGLAEGRIEGKAEGRAEGKVEGEITTKLSVALAQLNILDDATIANTLSLPIELVKRLRAGEKVEKIQEELLAEGPVIRA